MSLRSLTRTGFQKVVSIFSIVAIANIFGSSVFFRVGCWRCWSTVWYSNARTGSCKDPKKKGLRAARFVKISKKLEETPQANDKPLEKYLEKCMSQSQIKTHCVPLSVPSVRRSPFATLEFEASKFHCTLILLAKQILRCCEKGSEEAKGDRRRVRKKAPHKTTFRVMIMTRTTGADNSIGATDK
jgi:hypothetical protein